MLFVTLHHELPTSMLPQQLNVLNPVCTQRQELGKIMDLVHKQNQGQEHFLVSVPEWGQRLPVLVSLNEYNGESVLLTQAMHACL